MMQTEKKSMPKYAIVATCDPYHARLHYHGEQVLKYDMATPIMWVHDTFDTWKEAMERLKSDYAEVADGYDSPPEHNFRRGSGYYEDDVMSYCVESAKDIKKYYGEVLRDRWDFDDEEYDA